MIRRYQIHPKKFVIKSQHFQNLITKIVIIKFLKFLKSTNHRYKILEETRISRFQIRR